MINKAYITFFYIAHKTPQKNEVVEKKTRGLQEMTITLLSKSGIPFYLWVKVVNLTYYILNKVFIRSIIKKNPYKFWTYGRSNITYFYIFSYKCFYAKKMLKIT